MLTTMADHRGFGMSVTMGKKLSSFKKKKRTFFCLLMCVCLYVHVGMCTHACICAL